MEKDTLVKVFIGSSAFAVIVWMAVAFSPKKEVPERPNSVSPRVSEQPPAKDYPEQKMGDEMLVSYASQGSDGQKDLQLFFNYLQNVFLLIKSRDSHQYAINEDLADFLRGKNDYKTPFVSADSHIFNEAQMIVDRWGTPIHIHTISRDRFELRSAGPDKRLYSGDDFFWPHPDKPY